MYQKRTRRVQEKKGNEFLLNRQCARLDSKHMLSKKSVESALAYVRHRDQGVLADIDDQTLAKVILTPWDPSVEALVCRLLPPEKRVRCKIAAREFC